MQNNECSPATSCTCSKPLIFKKSTKTEYIKTATTQKLSIHERQDHRLHINEKVDKTHKFKAEHKSADEKINYLLLRHS